MPVNLKVTGLEKTIKRLDNIRKRSSNSNGFWNIYALKAYKQVIKNFEEENGKNGLWPELDDKTIKQRRKKSSKPLQDTGRLKGSILFKALKDGAIVFTNVKYAIYHNKKKGSRSRPAPKIPKRQFMWVPNAFKKKLVDAYAKFLTKGEK